MMTSVIPRLAMSELSTYRWTFEEDLQHYAAAGFQGIGVWRSKLIECGEERGVDLLYESGLAVSSMTWAGGFTGSDGRTFEFSLDDALETLRLAAVIRSHCLIVYTGGRGGHTQRHARRLACKALTELVQAASELDVIVAVEPMHPGCGLEWTFLNSLESTLELIEEVPGLQLVFDIYHWGHLPWLAQQLSALVPHVALIQLADATHEPRGEQDRLPLGRGTLPLAELSQSLSEDGYNGFFETELIGPEIESTDYDLLLSETIKSLESLSSAAH